MPMTGAERARRHREKLKENPILYDQYLKKEKERYARRRDDGQIKLAKDMTKRELRYARKAWRRRKRDQKRMQDSLNHQLNETPPTSPNTSSAETYQRQPRKESGRKRVRKDKSSCYRRVEKLTVKLRKKTREADMYRKRLQRQDERAQNVNSPKTKTNILLRGQRVSNAAKRSLLFHNVLIKSLKEKYKQAKADRDKKLLDKVFAKSLLKKYRITSMAAKELGVNMKRFKQTTKDSKTARRREPLVAAMRLSVEKFLSRDDNSRIKAGKRSTKTYKKNKKQIRLLTDHLKTLHLKYTLEHDRKMSYSLFCRLRPFYIRHPRPSDRETCLCKRHENLRFKAIKLKQLSVLTSSDLRENARHIVCDEMKKECMYRECPECREKQVPVNSYDGGQMTEWFEWKTKRFEKPVENEMKMVTMTVKEKENGTIENLIEEFQKEIEKSCKHFFNITNQYQSLRSLKTKLTDKDVICHIDFSENYYCKYEQEIQSMHFGASQRQVSLHTGMLYLKGTKESFCSFSDNLKHGPVGIWAHMLPILQWCRERFPEAENLFFISDGPTTQYRCKDNFFLMSTVPFGLGFKSVNWNFMEAGHGKGAPDGIGAVIKRAADKAVLCGNDVTDATTMYRAVSSSQVISRLFLVEDDQFTVPTPNPCANVRAVPGTMKIHQMFTTIPGQVTYRDVSCFCKFPNTCECHMPQQHVLSSNVGSTAKSNDQGDNDGPESSGIKRPDQFDESLIESYCVVTYDGNPYPGIIQDVDEQEIEVNVMHRIGENRFFWPRLQDVLWYSRDKFVTLIPPPEKIGSRHNQICPAIWDLIKDLLDI